MDIKKKMDSSCYKTNDLKRMKSLHGLTRTLIHNMVVGVTTAMRKFWKSTVLVTELQSRARN